MKSKRTSGSHSYIEKAQSSLSYFTLLLRRYVVLLVLVLALLLPNIIATPDGVTIIPISNSTGVASAGGLLNTTGGSITTVNISGSTQNVRWKAFIGNVSGTLTLDDAVGATIYDWELSAISGEVYSTRKASVVNWTGIGCATTNMTEHENRLMNHSSVDDNITATFDSANNDAVLIGTIQLQANSCLTINLYINSTTNQEDTFEQVVLNDFNNTPLLVDGDFTGSIVYAQILEDASLGYDNQSLYDFQIIVPERGEDGFASSTAYYFYVELS